MMTCIFLILDVYFVLAVPAASLALKSYFKRSITLYDRQCISGHWQQCFYKPSQDIKLTIVSFLVLFLHFCRKTRLIKQASVCVCVCVCVSVYVCMCVSMCVCVCVKFWFPQNNFQISYPIDTNFWLHIVSYRKSPTPLIAFLNFENCAREKFLNFVFLHLINIGIFSNLYYASDTRVCTLKFSIQVVPLIQIAFLTQNIIYTLFS